jgi:hypothetical protein
LTTGSFLALSGDDVSSAEDLIHTNDKMNSLPKILLLIASMIVAVGISRSASAQAERGALQSLQEALTGGDVNALSSIASERVELTLFGTAAMYSRGQAMYVLADFFRQHPPERVSFSEGSRAGANWFIMGEYTYEGGEQPLRMFVRLRDRDGRWELRELRIDRRGGS